MNVKLLIFLLVFLAGASYLTNNYADKRNEDLKKMMDGGIIVNKYSWLKRPYERPFNREPKIYAFAVLKGEKLETVLVEKQYFENVNVSDAFIYRSS